MPDGWDGFRCHNGMRNSRRNRGGQEESSKLHKNPFLHWTWGVYVMLSHITTPRDFSFLRVRSTSASAVSSHPTRRNDRGGSPYLISTYETGQFPRIGKLAGQRTASGGVCRGHALAGCVFFVSERPSWRSSRDEPAVPTRHASKPQPDALRAWRSPAPPTSRQRPAPKSSSSMQDQDQ